MTHLPLYESPVLSPIRSYPLNAIVTSCGHSLIEDQQYSYDGMRRGNRPFAVLQFTVSGIGNLQWRGGCRTLSSGSVMVARIPGEHRYWHESSDGPWEFVYVCLAGSEPLRAVDAVVDRRGPVLERAQNARLSARMHRTVLDVMNGDLREPFELSARAYHLTMDLLAESHLSPADPHHVELVRRARRMLKEQFADAPSIATIAEELGVSREHLTRIFTATAGVTPHTYLEELRLQRALELLYATSEPVKSVAARCGFHDGSYFSRVFRRYTGLSPTQHRRTRM